MKRKEPTRTPVSGDYYTSLGYQKIELDNDSIFWYLTDTTLPTPTERCLDRLIQQSSDHNRRSTEV